jgi:hypothetical protein
MPPPSPFAQPTPPPPPGFGTAFVPHDSPPIATVVPAGTAGKRSKGKVIGGLIAVVALLGAGGFAVSKIVAGDDGGASSPSEVGTQLMDSLAAEDALGVVDLLLPGERETMRQPLIDFVDHLKRLKVVDESADLGKVGGIDLSFQDVQVETTATNVDDISDIHITGTGTASVDGAKVPIGDLLIDKAFDGERPDLDSEAQTTDIDWNLATVERDGRWYLSAFYSIAENARHGAGEIPAVGVPLNGSDTPEDAVRTMLDAITDLDLEGLIGSLNPNEAEALQRYAPMFLDDASNSIDQVDPGIQISDMKFSVNGSGDRRSVTVDAATIKAGTGDDAVTVEKKDGCVTMTHGDEVTNTCDGANSIDAAIAGLGLGENSDLKAFITTVQNAFSDMKPVGITVQKVGGQWYVSPVGTFADVLLAALAALDNQELTAIIDAAVKLSGSVLTGGLLGDTSLAGSSDSGNSDTGNSDTGNSDTGDATGFEKCFAASDYATYSACIAAGVSDGSIDPTILPPYDRFTDCGVGEQYWNGDVYSMTDEAFTAFAIANAPCFKKYVDDGTISEFELPYELARPDCLEGRNWYNVTEQDYVDRVVSCATT